MASDYDAKEEARAFRVTVHTDDLRNAVAMLDAVERALPDALRAAHEAGAREMLGRVLKVDVFDEHLSRCECGGYECTDCDYTFAWARIKIILADLPADPGEEPTP